MIPRDVEFEGLSLEELRDRWRSRYGAAPALRSPELLALVLAWRIQADDQGGLDVDLRRALRRPAGVRTAPAPTAGTRLVREWDGIAHEVIVTSEGEFLYQGDHYRSLSEVARHITGVRWNGPRFFGLRGEAAAG
ncbi:MAG: DUF2924 domain-containing protein [Phenylobacterium sp.]|uniref:DUF2924 domain-containing protein n=1 Tax=Phenylobacterium sp. TaxID=1871053 RepID=UPI002732665F|nr:DUF2924 domain-containing protein [Phenylobacterium sp.]MDP3173734.1 DUF2924 domain-containing protein [Phenylobacterium sp.]